MPHLNLIRRWEGLKLRAYQDTGGVWTIGYGHTHTVTPGMAIDKVEAERLLAVDVAWAEDAVDRLVRVPLNTNQRAALISWVYNIGETQAASSTLIERLNTGDYDAVPGQMARWVYDNGQIIRGLQNRRADEAALWLEPIAPLNPLSRSRTILAAIVGTITTVLTWFQEQALALFGLARDAASSGYGWQLMRLLEQSQPVVMLIVLAVVVYARIDDHRKRRR